ncbi:hypothetical protein BDM02DRAFT_3127366 [Thelephora ganbajun]|uniref:Uncharacterized protein n=1 Tax=Thelephora ganbajun TaxID=370292 RepID=A0ACB6ZN52_THEGA|nr:hypothetical protein BDM02DRAFT_3127366 [Thelephora ganbajun]
MAPGLADFKYSALAFFLISGLITVVRIALRVQKRMFWWDDFWATVSLACFTTFVPGVFIIADGPSFPQHIRIAGYYMVGGFFYCTVWAARLSIIFTVVRIAPWASQKRVMLVIALVMFLQWVLLMVQMFWVCEKGSTSWKQAPFALCPLGLHVAITQAVTESFSDLLLIVAPLWILRNVRVTSAVRFRLISVFACSLATTIAALAHAILVIRLPGVWEAIVGSLEAGVALAVCNLSVIVPAAARLLGGDSEKYQDESKDYATATIGGSGASKNTRNINDTMLSTFKVDPTASSGAVRVDVTVEQDQANWEAKKDIEAASGEDIYHLPLHKN